MLFMSHKHSTAEGKTSHVSFEFTEYCHYYTNHKDAIKSHFYSNILQLWKRNETKMSRKEKHQGIEMLTLLCERTVLKGNK